jgi:predicted phosphoribosyltransferase
MHFVNRIDAANQLAVRLAEYRGQQPLVLAIPRGGVEMGHVIAEALAGELDVVLVHKLRSQFQPELAIGAVDESGWVYLASWADRAGTPGYLEKEKQHQISALQERRQLYTPARAPIDACERIAIVVDDGLATGATMIAALHAVRAQRPRKLVCAVPVAAPGSVEAVRPHADEVVVLQTPAGFHAVGQYYGSFPQVSDEEVIRLLAPNP